MNIIRENVIRDIYLTAAEMKRRGFEVGVIGKSVLGCPIPYIKKGDARFGEAMIFGAIHAREYATAPLVLKMAEEYGGGSAIYFIPLVNVDGVALAVHGIDFIDRLGRCLGSGGGSVDCMKCERGYIYSRRFVNSPNIFEEFAEIFDVSRDYSGGFEGKDDIKNDLESRNYGVNYNTKNDLELRNAAENNAVSGLKFINYKGNDAENNTKNALKFGCSVGNNTKSGAEYRSGEWNNAINSAKNCLKFGGSAENNTKGSSDAFGRGALSPFSENLIKINGYDRDFSLWKANVNAVDLNVNFDADWGTGIKNARYPAPENYIGPFPESEPETKALINITKEHDFSCVLCYHCKGEVIYYGYKNSTPSPALAAEISKATGYPLAESVGSAGGYKDWFTERFGKPAFTIEVGNEGLSYAELDGQFDAIYRQNERLTGIVNAYSMRMRSE
ncbi:MAG: hypothetical protein LBP62_03620 [Clostridiales bacterium]|jgi:hypothetical protein|nr:hypothetical protein [Clostridiales bacterium]